MGRKTPEDTAITRRKLIDSGVDIFSSQGLAASTLDQIARHAGYSRGAVYWHFKGKEELLQTLLDDCILPLECFWSPDHDLQEGLMALSGALEKTLSDPRSRKLCEILLHKGERSGGETPVSRRLIQAQQATRNQLESLLAQACAQGVLPTDFDITGVTVLIQMCLTGLVFECLQIPCESTHRINTLMITLTDLLFRPE